MKKLFVKWWSWLIIFAIVVVLGIITVNVVVLNLSSKGIHEVARSIQLIDNEAILYSSSGENTIIIEVNDSSKERIKQMENVISSYTGSNKTLSNYSKCIFYIQTNIENNTFLVKNVYTLPNMEQDTKNEKIYMDISNNQ